MTSTSIQRAGGRAPNALRDVRFVRNFTRYAEGSVLVEFGATRVLCTASIEDGVPGFLRGKGQGWVTAEYGMLPRATHTRGQREAARGKQTGRTQEIQRLIGRALRAVMDMSALGERTVTLDCDVLQADGGTRTAAITGSYVALADACASLVRRRAIAASPLHGQIAAVSVGIVRGVPLLDLDYAEDSTAETDMNVVMNEGGAFIEVQGTAEGHAFRRHELDSLLDLASGGIQRLCTLQAEAPCHARRNARRVCSSRQARCLTAPPRSCSRAATAASSASSPRSCNPCACTWSCRASSASRPRRRPATPSWPMRCSRRVTPLPRRSCPRSPTTPVSKWTRSAVDPASTPRATPRSPPRTVPRPHRRATPTTQPTCSCCCAELEGVPDERRGARYQCALAWVASADDPAPLTAQAHWEGRIARTPLGSGGFGYDPIFVPTGSALTVAQLAPAEKARASHRALALQALMRCCARTTPAERRSALRTARSA